MSADNPQNPFAISLTPGSQPQLKSMGRGGEVYSSEDHGKYYAASYYNRLFEFTVHGVTLPAIGATMVSVFSLYNPPTSSVNLEIVDVDIGLVLATTVVDTVGLYWQGPTLASLATLTTIGVIGTNWFPALLGGLPGQGNPYSALTHSGTPVRVDIVSQFGGITSVFDQPIHKEYDGKMLLTPGCVLSAAASTAATFTNGLDIGIRWLEASVT